MSLTVLLIGVINWRYGVIAVFLVGVLQDPLRKMTPGLPNMYLIWSTVLFAIIVFFAFRRLKMQPLRVISLYDHRLQQMWRLFVGLVILHAAHALVRWGSPVLPVLGLAFYLGPIVALVFGYYFARDERWVRRLMIGYIVIVVPAALTVYLSVDYADQYPVLKDIGWFVGREMKIYDVGTVLASHPGIFRVGEIAAWHAATASIMLYILAIQDRRTFWRVVAAIFIVLLIGVIVLTGRRKMLGALTIFLAAQLFILSWYRKGAVKQAILVAVLGLVGMIGFSFMESAEEESLYLQRGVSVFDSAEARFETAFGLAKSAVYRGSGIGLGTGAAAQGSQHFGGRVAAGGGSGEAGIGKILIELGIPGLIVILLLLGRLFVVIKRTLRQVAAVDDRLLYYVASFLGFFVGNMVTFIVAAQVYGDFFVLIVIGLMAGILFSIMGAGIRAFHQQRQVQGNRSHPLPQTPSPSGSGLG